MNVRVIVFVALGSIAAVVHADEPNGDLDKLQGTWNRIKYYKSDGQEVPEKDEHTVTFQKDNMIFRSNAGGQNREGTWKIKLDDSTTPKSYDWVNSVPPRPGIYELEGDTLRVAFAMGPRADWTRPTKLAPCPPDSPTRWTYIVYKRGKP